MNRRAFLASFGAALLAAPLAAEVQPTGKVYRIGFLSAGKTPPFGPLQLTWSLEAFRDGLHELGYVDGRDVLIESRFADAQLDRLPTLAAELVALQVDVLVTVGTRAVQAAKAATATIPIVMAGVTDPVEHGIVGSLARPGGNVTGTTYSPGPEIHGKGLELLKEAVPGSRGWRCCGTRARSPRGPPSAFSGAWRRNSELRSYPTTSRRWTS